MQGFSRIPDMAQVAPASGQLEIPLRLSTAPNSLLSQWMVAVIVILMDRDYDGRKIHDGLVRLKRLPHHPVIPADASHRQSGYVRSEKAA